MRPAHPRAEHRQGPDAYEKLATLERELHEKRSHLARLRKSQLPYTLGGASYREAQEKIMLAEHDIQVLLDAQEHARRALGVRAPQQQQQQRHTHSAPPSPSPSAASAAASQPAADNEESLPPNPLERYYLHDVGGAEIAGPALHDASSLDTTPEPMAPLSEEDVARWRRLTRNASPPLPVRPTEQQHQQQQQKNNKPSLSSRLSGYLSDTAAAGKRLAGKAAKNLSKRYAERAHLKALEAAARADALRLDAEISERQSREEERRDQERVKREREERLEELERARRESRKHASAAEEAAADALNSIKLYEQQKAIDDERMRRAAAAESSASTLPTSPPPSAQQQKEEKKIKKEAAPAPPRPPTPPPVPPQEVIYTHSPLPLHPSAPLPPPPQLSSGKLEKMKRELRESEERLAKEKLDRELHVGPPSATSMHIHEQLASHIAPRLHDTRPTTPLSPYQRQPPPAAGAPALKKNGKKGASAKIRRHGGGEVEVVKKEQQQQQQQQPTPQRNPDSRPNFYVHNDAKEEPMASLSEEPAAGGASHKLPIVVEESVPLPLEPNPSTRSSSSSPTIPPPPPPPTAAAPPPTPAYQQKQQQPPRSYHPMAYPTTEQTPPPPIPLHSKKRPRALPAAGGGGGGSGGGSKLVKYKSNASAPVETREEQMALSAADSQSAQPLPVFQSHAPHRGFIFHQQQRGRTATSSWQYPSPPPPSAAAGANSPHLISRTTTETFGF
jgi:hypothetical protein